MSPAEGLKFATDFDVVPDICNRQQFKDLWVLVNNSEAADDDAEQCDSEEFVELLVRLSVMYAPTSTSLREEHGLADCFRVLLTFMNNSAGGKERKLNMKVDKITGH